MSTLHHPLAIPPSGGRRCVLLVEDNPGDAGLAIARLTEDSDVFDIAHVSTAAEAMAFLSLRSVDAIVLDLGLPDSDGVETLRRIRQIHLSTPVIVVTGRIDLGLRSRVLDTGGDEVYTKDETNSRLFWRSVLQIIERKRVQQEQLPRILDTLPDGVIVVTLDGTVRYVNQAAVDIFRSSREELLGEPLGFSVRDDEPMEITVPDPGNDRVCEIRVVPLLWNDQAAHLAIVRDITERKLSETLKQRADALEAENQRILAASQTKSTFLANMSHELRTPLNAIIGFSQLMQSGAVDPQSDKFPTFIGYIVTSARHLLDLINDILDLAKIEAGRIDLRPVDVEPLVLVQEVLDVLGETARQKGIGVHTVFDSSIARIHTDPSRFKQVLFNYLSNAMKFTPRDGTVTVALSIEDGERLRLEVTDTGIGISEDDQRKLFTEFQQLEAGMAKRHQGTGLGLAITRRLIEAQNGQVGVRSTLGQGSTFWATLPLQTSRQPHESQVPT